MISVVSLDNQLITNDN